jgi:sigma-B regulation protein RsbU (phosphoserine phosphatase)
MNKILDHFDRQSKFTMLVRAYITIVLITFLDYVTGPQLSMFILYFFPVIIVSWFVDKKHGNFIVVVAAVAALIHDLMFLNYFGVQLISELMIFWNFIQRLFVFILVSMIVSALREAETDKVQSELKIAQQVQSFLLPQTYPMLKTLSYHAVRKSFSSVSGDFYDFILIEPHKLLIVIGDICGKGMPAALLMAHIHGIMRGNAISIGDNLIELVNVINNSLYASTDSNKFATMFLGIYDDRERTLSYINAGHNPPMLIKHQNEYQWNYQKQALNTITQEIDEQDQISSLEIERLNTDNFLLGIEPNICYTQKTQQLEPGDSLILFTDGITEARNYLKDQYGEKRFAKIITDRVSASPKILCGAVLEDVKAFVGMERQADDMTMIIGKVN